jgi:CheY-like chemotaxis protein/tetratricopeptide (TPR) repeat protein
VIEASEGFGKRLQRGLCARGLRVTLTESVVEATRLLRSQGCDVVVLGIPLPGVDSVACCAALKEGPAPPPLVLLDATGQAAELEITLPRGMRPDAVMPRPVDSTKLLLQIHEILEHLAAEDTDAAGGGLQLSLPEILIDLGERAETGILEIRAEGVCTRIHLDRGRPVFAEGGSLRDTLGRLLLRRGEISQQDYVRVIERMTERLVENEPLRMGEVLIELGLLTPNDVYDALAQQVADKIIACFRYPRFSHSFHPLEATSEEMLAFDASTLEALILAGMKEHFGPGRVELLVRPHSARYALLRAGAAETGKRFRMNSTEQKFLMEIRGNRTVAQLQRDSSLGAAHAGQLLAALLVARELALTDAPGAHRAAVRRGTARPQAPPPASPRSPSREARPARPAQQPPQRPDSLSQLFGRLQKLPGSKPPAQPVDERQAKLEAERSFRSGMVLLRQNMLPGALRDFARASELQPNEPEYRMYEAWVAHLVARGKDEKTLTRAKAHACATRLLQEDRESAKAHAILGQLARANGELDAADRHFRVALRYDPQDRDAQRGLRLLSKRRPH